MSAWYRRLTDAEWQAATDEAVKARDIAHQLGRANRAGLARSDELLAMAMGVAGEMAFSAMTGLPRLHLLHDPAGIGAPDFAPDIELVTRSRATYDLLIRPEREPARRFVLMVCVFPWAFEARGWLPGRVAMQDAYLQAYAGRPAAYFVPQQQLLPMPTFTLQPSVPLALPW